MRTKRKCLIEERYHGIKKSRMDFVRMVQERAAKMQTSLAPFLPNDLMFKIFLRLPISSLMRFSCVCKSWNNLIHCAEFFEAYNCEAPTTPIFLRNISKERPSKFHVETQYDQSQNFSLFPCDMESRKSKSIHFLDIVDGKGKVMDFNISCSGSIVASFNGLILIMSMHKQENHLPRETPLQMPLFDSHEKPGRLIIMNPTTRKFSGIPLGTVSNKESYGIVFSYSKAVYKVVHLFKEKAGFIACEILNLQTRTWKAVDGPSEGLFKQFGNAPITASGALHWLPDVVTDYIVSMGVEDERFYVIELPMTLRVHDRLVEMGGSLTVVIISDEDHIEVWVLKELEGTHWVKQHTVRLDSVSGYMERARYSAPSFALNAKEMVFRTWRGLYSYDFEHEEIKEIEMDGGGIRGDETLIVHSNNLASWEPLEPMS